YISFSHNALFVGLYTFQRRYSTDSRLYDYHGDIAGCRHYYHASSAGPKMEGKLAKALANLL
ncbi:hypothetical protein, partial [Trueperella pyogenes]